MRIFLGAANLQQAQKAAQSLLASPEPPVSLTPCCQPQLPEPRLHNDAQPALRVARYFAHRFPNFDKLPETKVDPCSVGSKCKASTDVLVSCVAWYSCLCPRVFLTHQHLNTSAPALASQGTHRPHTHGKWSLVVAQSCDFSPMCSLYLMLWQGS
jgi:hypothetical protein